MITYDEGQWLFSSLLHARGSVIPRALVFSVPAALFTWALVVIEEDTRSTWLHPFFGQGFQDVSDAAGTIWGAMTGVLVLLLVFRTRGAMNRFWEGSGLLHQMRGEWFDAVSCLMTFSRENLGELPDEVGEFRHTLVRLMSLCHGSALEELKDVNAECDNFDVLDLKGLHHKTLEFLAKRRICYDFNRVEVVLHQIHVLIVHNVRLGVLTIESPVLSRVFQTLSRGHVNLLNATKIRNTLFPLPYAQVLALLLLIHTVWTPFVVASCVKHPLLAVMICFVPLLGAYTVNFAAIQLEQPFGIDPNDLPMREFQHEMNKCLLMLLHPSSDLLPRTSRACTSDWESLAESELPHRGKRKFTSSSAKSNTMFEMAIASAMDSEIEARSSRGSDIVHMLSAMMRRGNLGGKETPGDLVQMALDSVGTQNDDNPEQTILQDLAEVESVCAVPPIAKPGEMLVMMHQSASHRIYDEQLEPALPTTPCVCAASDHTLPTTCCASVSPSYHPLQRRSSVSQSSGGALPQLDDGATPSASQPREAGVVPALPGAARQSRRWPSVRFGEPLGATDRRPSLLLGSMPTDDGRPMHSDEDLT